MLYIDLGLKDKQKMADHTVADMLKRNMNMAGEFGKFGIMQ